jgi:hypothetical protein
VGGDAITSVHLLLRQWLFDYANEVQLRLAHNGRKRRFPDWLVAGSILVVAITYSLGRRGAAIDAARGC